MYINKRLFKLKLYEKRVEYGKLRYIFGDLYIYDTLFQRHC